MLKELYDMKSIVDLRSIGGGFTTENFIFSDGRGTFFLKRYNTTDTRRIHDIASAYDRFARGGIPVIQPIKTNQGESCFFLDDAWWGVFPFVDGNSRQSKELTFNEVGELGRMLGHIHRVGQSCPKNDIQPMALWNKEIFTSEKHLLEYAFEHLENPREVDAMAIGNIRIQDSFLTQHAVFMANLRPANDCLIHGDFTHNNIFWDTSGRIHAVFDLDKTCVASRAYELARSTLIICFDHAWNKTSFALAQAFIQSYLTTHPMDFEEFRTGLDIYIANYMHMTWLERKIILNKSLRHEEILRSSQMRVNHLATEFETLAERLFPPNNRHNR